MALSIVQRKRGSWDGSAFRIYELTHTGAAATTLTAGSMGMNHIEAIVGVNSVVPLDGTIGSSLAQAIGISIAADNKSLIWASTVAMTQTVTVVGW